VSTSPLANWFEGRAKVRQAECLMEDLSLGPALRVLESARTSFVELDPSTDVNRQKTKTKKMRKLTVALCTDVGGRGVDNVSDVCREEPHGSVVQSSSFSCRSAEFDFRD
jgi:hypothetical protein